MHVEKIEIPAFRVLRDVVLEFGGVYDPQIFPLGSENGGGKSTLLQLVFALLHCSANEQRLPYLERLLSSDSYTADEDERLIARLTLRIEEKLHVLEFVSLDDRFLARKLDDAPTLGFGGFQNAFGSLLDMPKPVPSPDVLKREEDRIDGLLLALNYHLVMRYQCLAPGGGKQICALICRMGGRDASEIEEVLLEVESRVFLLGPSNQQYLFLGKDARRALLGTNTVESTEAAQVARRNSRPQIEYMTRLDEAESTMSGFYAYDWLSVMPLIRLFAEARDEDFKSVVKTGTYGNSYNKLLREVNMLVVGKEVRPLDDLSGVEFIIKDERGREIPLSPEDLSRGELKRLMIYAWLRANHARDALVLIDEIETSFHPDWQAGIVRDLQEWAPDTQFLLATHSYEVCQALTPRHVRELRPWLRWSSTTADEQGEPEPRDG